MDINDALNETADPEHQFSLRSSMDLPRHIEFDAALRWVDTLHTNSGAIVGTVPSYFELDTRLAWHASDGSNLRWSAKTCCTTTIPNTASRLRRVPRSSAASMESSHGVIEGESAAASGSGACLMAVQALELPPMRRRNIRCKAVFLFNFSHFVEWPPQAFAAPNDALRHRHRRGAILSARSWMRRCAASRSTAIRWSCAATAAFREVDNCQILFIDRSEIAPSASKSSPPWTTQHLTVSDRPTRAAERGVMIQFVTENSRIRLRINVDSARAAGLTISSKLLRPAEIVGTGRQGADDDADHPRPFAAH